MTQDQINIVRILTEEEDKIEKCIAYMQESVNEFHVGYRSGTMSASIHSHYLPKSINEEVKNFTLQKLRSRLQEIRKKLEEL